MSIDSIRTAATRNLKANSIYKENNKKDTKTKEIKNNNHKKAIAILMVSVSAAAIAGIIIANKKGYNFNSILNKFKKAQVPANTKDSTNTLNATVSKKENNPIQNIKTNIKTVKEQVKKELADSLNATVEDVKTSEKLSEETLAELEKIEQIKNEIINGSKKEKLDLDSFKAKGHFENGRAIYEDKPFSGEIIVTTKKENSLVKNSLKYDEGTLKKAIKSFKKENDSDFSKVAEKTYVYTKEGRIASVNGKNLLDYTVSQENGKTLNIIKNGRRTEKITSAENVQNGVTRLQFGEIAPHYYYKKDGKTIRVEQTYDQKEKYYYITEHLDNRRKPVISKSPFPYFEFSTEKKV